MDVDSTINSLRWMCNVLKNVRDYRRPLGSLEAISFEHILKGGLGGIRGWQNAFLPINKLPPEILENIFLHVPESLTSLDGCQLWPWARTHTSADIVPISSVCSRWRRICLAAPFLWSGLSIELENDRIVAEELLARAGPTTALHITIIQPFSRPDDYTVTLVGTESHRLEELHVKCRRPFPLFQTPAPILKHLTVSTLSRLPDNQSNLTEFFCGFAPNLLSLTLQTPWLPNNQFFLLTHLCIVGYDSDAIDGLREWSLPQLCMLLARCPSLEEITFVHIDEISEQESADQEHVQLPRLRRVLLRGEGCTRFLEWLLKHFTWPHGSALWVHASTWTLEDELPDIIRKLSKVSLDAERLDLHVAMKNGQDSTFTLSMSSAIFSLHVSIHIETASRVLPPKTNIWEELISETMLLSHVRVLQINDSGWVQHFINFSQLSPLLPELDTLVYSEGDNDLLPLLLSHLVPAENWKQCSNGGFCAKLSHLVVYIGEVVAMYESIVEFALQRMRSGLPLITCTILYEPSVSELLDPYYLQQFVKVVQIMPSSAFPLPVPQPVDFSEAAYGPWP